MPDAPAAFCGGQTSETPLLLDNVESLLFRFLDDNGGVTEVWPPQNAAGASGMRVRPRAVEIILTLPDEGEITRLLEIAP